MYLLVPGVLTNVSPTFSFLALFGKYLAFLNAVMCSSGSDYVCLQLSAGQILHTGVSWCLMKLGNASLIRGLHSGSSVNPGPDQPGTGISVFTIQYLI